MQLAFTTCVSPVLQPAAQDDVDPSCSAGGVIGVHGDDNGLQLPPQMAPVQVGISVLCALPQPRGNAACQRPVSRNRCERI